MQRFVICFGFVYLFLQQIVVTQERALEPAQVLRAAIDKMRLCPYQKPAREKLDHEHMGLETLEQTDAEEERDAKKLSLYQMFRPGRYQLESEVRRAVYEDREALVVEFSPQPEEKRLKPLKGEDEGYDWAMNLFYGKAIIDAENRGLMRVEARVPTTASFEKKGVEIVKLHELRFELDQKLWGSDWLPFMIQTEFRLTHRRWYFPVFFWKERHERYTTHFNCGPA